MSSTTTTFAHPAAQAAHPATGHFASDSPRVMRQTQGFIGTVILAGLGLGYFVEPLFLILPAIIGGGLLMAGSTGLCPMAGLISRMPWNKTQGGKASCGSGCCGR